MENNFSLLDKIKFLKGRVSTMINGHVLVASYELTLSCNCNCHHCDLGGFKKEEKRIGPEDYARITRNLNPIAVQLSGGEPLLRKDIVDIARSVKQFGGLPYTILVSNGSLLNKDIYLKLREVGVNQFSISLDFPDERHDEFRRHPGLFSHLEKTIPDLTQSGCNNIILNSAITSANYKEAIPLAKKAIEWGTSISYSAYTPLRTGNREYTFEKDEDAKALAKTIKELIEFKRKTNCIVNSEDVLLKELKYLKRGYMPGCKAGMNFVVVMPDGKFIPCSMRRQKFSSLEELREGFSKNNTCDGCYVSIRCYSERPFLEELKNLPEYIKISSGHSS